MKFSSLLLLALITVSLTANADIYRWVDKQGRVHYSDRPMPGAVLVKNRDATPVDAAAATARAESLRQQRQAADTAGQKTQADANAAKAVNQDMAKIADERCKKAKEAYRVATESQRLYRMNAAGEREYLSDAEIAEARIAARKALDEACPKTGG